MSCLYLETGATHENPAVVRLWRELWRKSYASHARHKKRRTLPALIGLVSVESVTRAGREVYLNLSFGLHIAIERVPNPIIKDPSESLVDRVLRCILN